MIMLEAPETEQSRRGCVSDRCHTRDTAHIPLKLQTIAGKQQLALAA